MRLDIDINMKKIGFVIILVLSLLKNIHGVKENVNIVREVLKHFQNVYGAVQKKNHSAFSHDRW